MIAFLPVDENVLVAGLPKRGEREFTVAAFGFLKADDVGRMPAEKIDDQPNAQTNGIDVPGRDLDVQVQSPGAGAVSRALRKSAPFIAVQLFGENAFAGDAEQVRVRASSSDQCCEGPRVFRSLADP